MDGRQGAAKELTQVIYVGRAVAVAIEVQPTVQSVRAGQDAVRQTVLKQLQALAK